MTDNTSTQDQSPIVLPRSIISKLDLSHMVSEVEQIDNDLTTVAVRQKAGVNSDFRPVPSDQLGDFLAVNNLEIGDGQQRSRLITELKRLKDQAPIVHMTFATAADRESLSELADWIRKSVHPQTLIVVGLQPDLVGGVYVRTPNHVHDLSVRAQLAGHRDILIKEVEALSVSR